jgi:signal transduction histidine kinase/DNA-binding response OmpR family regulator
VGGTGLVRYNPRTKRVTELVKCVDPRAVCVDSAGRIWVGDGVHLVRGNPQGGMFERVWQIPGSEPNDGIIDGILLASDGSVWISSTRAVYHVTGDLGNYTRYTHDPGNPASIAEGNGWYLAEDTARQIWLGGIAGLSRFNPAKGSFDRFGPVAGDSASLSHGNVLNLHLDASGTLWVATKHGLNRFDPATSRFRRFYPETWRHHAMAFSRGAGELSIGDITEDARGFLWIASIRDIFRFDPRTGSFVSFDESDGLGDFVPVFGQSVRLRDGTVVYGAPGGILMFHPDNMRPSNLVPPVVITGVRKLDRPATAPVGPDGIPQLVVEHDDNVITVDFAVLSYDMPAFNRYAYRLEGFDGDWINPADVRQATYTNLDPGTYTFRVKGANHDGIWNESGASLRILVRPPWWGAPWAYALYALAFAGIVLLVHRYQSERVRLREVARLKDLETRKLREVEQLKSRFFANISHEFRTPLTLILGPVERWRQQSSDASLQADLTMVERSARRLLRLVNQLLDLSRIEAGALKLRVAPGDLGALIRGVAWSFQSSAHTRGIEIRVDVPPELGEAVFDRERVEHILTNLLSNGFKFTPAGGTVDVCASVVAGPEPGTDDRWVEVTVSDTGIGIPAQDLPHIFDRFYQVNSSATREQGGTGIGLALTKELVDLHRGSITVTSTPGQGTEFRVRLPIGKTNFSPGEFGEAPDVGSQERLPAGAPAPAGESGVTSADLSSSTQPLLLIVEDNADLRAHIRATVSPDYRTVDATNGEEGVAKALELVPDIVISDVMMPKMDGYAVCRALKSDERTSHVPVILLTAKAGQESKIEGLDTGADDYLTKPFAAQELRARMRNLIALRKKLRERFSASQVLKPGEIAVTSMDDVFLRKAMAVVEERLSSEEFSVEELAVALAMSRSQLHRKLTALTGQAPVEFIRYMRLHRANSLLQQNAGTVSDVAYATGFGSVSYFSKCFREQFGTQPSEVKRSQP